MTLAGDKCLERKNDLKIIDSLLRRGVYDKRNAFCY